MKSLEKYIKQVHPVDRNILEVVQKRLDSQTKPLGSLGRLEAFCRLLASVQGTEKPSYEKKIIYTLAADHGVVEEGVSAYPKSVTAQMVKNFVNGGAGVNVLARHAGCEVVVVDMGVASDLDIMGCVDKKIEYGR